MFDIAIGHDYWNRFKYLDCVRKVVLWLRDCFRLSSHSGRSLKR